MAISLVLVEDSCHVLADKLDASFGNHSFKLLLQCLLHWLHLKSWSQVLSWFSKVQVVMLDLDEVFNNSFVLLNLVKKQDVIFVVFNRIANVELYDFKNQLFENFVTYELPKGVLGWTFLYSCRHLWDHVEKTAKVLVLCLVTLRIALDLKV